MNVDHVRKRGRIVGDEANYLISNPHLNDPKTNPCIIEQNLSSKCMHDNFYHAPSCEDAFLNFRECRRFWNSIKWGRFFSGERPCLPPPEERDQIKKRYLDDLQALGRMSRGGLD